jgi:hypothetical protein
VETKKPEKTRAAAPTRSKRPQAAIPAKPRRKRAAAVVLADAPPDKCFWVNCGPILKNLRELREALAGSISDEQFAYHVARDRNDLRCGAPCASARRTEPRRKSMRRRQPRRWLTFSAAARMRATFRSMTT